MVATYTIARLVGQAAERTESRHWNDAAVASAVVGMLTILLLVFLLIQQGAEVSNSVRDLESLFR
jgi:hypothetical protein